MRISRTRVSNISELTIDANINMNSKKLTSLAAGSGNSQSIRYQQAILQALLDTPGDMLVRGASVAGKLAKGTQNYYLKQGSTYPAWAEDLIAALLTTRGDILYEGSGGIARLGKGDDGQFLKIGANDPVWATVNVASVAVKTADQIVNNSETMVNDTHLLFAVGIDEVWEFLLVLRCITASTTPDIDYAFTVPSNGVIKRMRFFGTLTTEDDFTSALRLATGSTQQYYIVRGLYIGGDTAGNVQLQWAQFTATSEDTTIKADSFLIANKVSV